VDQFAKEMIPNDETKEPFARFQGHAPEITDKVLRDIVGHEGKDTHDRTYSKPTPPAVMQAAIERLPVVI